MITFARLTLLALADAVNPCAFAVLTMILITILLQNPENKKRVLHAGLLFSLAIFICYFIYGLILVQLFKGVAMFLSGATPYITKALAVFAIVLGAMNVRDYVKYKPGGIGTEMPLSLRPRVKLIIQSVTSPKGAFIAGILVTLFLLPCTIGPYLIASETIASEVNSIFDILIIAPWLLYYNLLFITPMVGITLLVYLGLKKVEDVSGWKDKNIKKIHLAAGLILICVGIAILLGWI